MIACEIMLACTIMKRRSDSRRENVYNSCHRSTPRLRSHSAECRHFFNNCHRSTPQGKHCALQSLIGQNVQGVLDIDASKPRRWKKRSVVCQNRLCILKTCAPETKFLKGVSQNVLWSATVSDVRECPDGADEPRNRRRAEPDL